MKENNKEHFVFSNAEFSDKTYRVILKNSENEKLMIQFDFSKFIITDNDNGNESFNNIRIILNEAFNPRHYKIKDEIKEELSKKIYNYIVYCVEQSNEDFNLFRNINIYHETDDGVEYFIEMSFKNKGPENKPPRFKIETLHISVNNTKKKETQEIDGENLEGPPYITFGFVPKYVSFIDNQGASEKYDYKTFLDIIEDNPILKKEFFENILPDIVNRTRMNII